MRWGGGGEGVSVEKSQSHNFCLFLLTFNRKPKILNEHHLIYYTIIFLKKVSFQVTLFNSNSNKANEIGY